MLLYCINCILLVLFRYCAILYTWTMKLWQKLTDLPPTLISKDQWSKLKATHILAPLWSLKTNDQSSKPHSFATTALISAHHIKKKYRIQQGDTLTHLFSTVMGDPKKKAPRRFFTKLPFKWFRSAPKARAELERPGQKAGWHQTPGSPHQGQPLQVSKSRPAWTVEAFLGCPFWVVTFRGFVSLRGCKRFWVFFFFKKAVIWALP